MFESTKALPHLLPPQAYYDGDSFRRESEILGRAWHVVATRDDLARDGDFITLELLGRPVQVRNFGGEIHALSNVCAHRHCLIRSETRGNSPKMSCQYHGWEYQACGRTGKIPQPKNFAPFDRDALRLPQFAIESVGNLVLINVADKPVPFCKTVGEENYHRMQERFGDGWEASLKWQPEFECNWKVVIENSLESYHVPNIHGTTFREDPGADRTEHFLSSTSTSMRTTLPFAPHSRIDRWFQNAESGFVRWIGEEVTGNYEQHHVFPNLLFSFTDAISLVCCVVPRAPGKCQAFLFQFGRQPANATRRVKKFASRRWGALKAGITKRILEEDRSVFAAIQRGLELSTQEGTLGACEERIHRFQAYLMAEQGKKEND
ncbi:MAG: aromatic ring-hydroxylating oxygenase subunit alpha [Aureliella sp.]